MKKVPYLELWLVIFRRLPLTGNTYIFIALVLKFEKKKHKKTQNILIPVDVFTNYRMSDNVDPD